MTKLNFLKFFILILIVNLNNNNLFSSLDDDNIDGLDWHAQQKKRREKAALEEKAKKEKAEAKAKAQREKDDAIAKAERVFGSQAYTSLRALKSNIPEELNDNKFLNIISGYWLDPFSLKTNCWQSFSDHNQLSLSSHAKCFINNMIFSPCSKYLALLVNSSQICVYALEKPENTWHLLNDSHNRLRLIAVTNQNALDIAFSPDGQYLAAISPLGEVQFFNYKLKNICSFNVNSTPTLSTYSKLLFSNDSKLLATSTDNMINLWVVDQLLVLQKDSISRLVKKIESPEPVTALAFSPRGNFLASARLDKKIFVFKLEEDIKFFRCFDLNDHKGKNDQLQNILNRLQDLHNPKEMAGWCIGSHNNFIKLVQNAQSGNDNDIKKLIELDDWYAYDAKLNKQVYPHFVDNKAKEDLGALLAKSNNIFGLRFLNNGGGLIAISHDSVRLWNFVLDGEDYNEAELRDNLNVVSHLNPIQRIILEYALFNNIKLKLDRNSKISSSALNNNSLGLLLNDKIQFMPAQANYDFYNKKDITDAAVNIKYKKYKKLYYSKINVTPISLALSPDGRYLAVASNLYYYNNDVVFEVFKTKDILGDLINSNFGYSEEDSE